MGMIEVHNPATGEKVGTVAPAGRSEIVAIAAAAREAQRAWAARPLTQRREVILRFHDLVLERESQLLDTIQAETGKSRRDAFTEVLGVAGTARYYAYSAQRHLRPRRHGGALPIVTRSTTRWVPHALVGLITPWNYPFLLSVADALPALIAGCGVIVKPSGRTPLSAERGRDLLVEAGLDRRLLGLVNGHREQAEDLIENVDYVAFTGGTATGRAVARRAGERLIGCSLELGGKNPMIVGEGARIDEVVEGLIAGSYLNSGQACISIERVYVVESLYDKFIEAAGRRIETLKLDWSPEWSVDMGSLISTDHADRVMGHIETAVGHGARIVAGGRRRQDLGPAFVEPTLLTDVQDASPVASEETFGPVVSVYRVRDGDEAVERANRSPFGLNASVWGRDADQMARRMDTGSTGIGSALQIYASFDVPMGGIRGSGLGRRHGAEGIRRYGTTRAIVKSPARWGGYDALWSRLTSSRSAALVSGLYRVWRRCPGFR